MPHVSRALHALVPQVQCALCALVSHVALAVRALVPHVAWALCGLVLFLLQTNFVNWQCTAFAQFYDSSKKK